MKIKQFVIAALFLINVVTATANAESDIRVTVHSDVIIRTYSESPFGINLNYIRDHDANRPSGALPLSDSIQSIGATWLRYPGGEKSDWHFFAPPPYGSDLVADSVITSRPDESYASQAMGHTLLDFDDFMDLCSTSGANPYVVVPSEPERRTGYHEDHYVEHAAAWVRYANVQNEYGVLYWEIGNENWHKDNSTGEVEAVADYLARALRIGTAMKAIDPSIKIGCSGENYEQFKYIIQNGGDVIDFISLSNYVGSASIGWHGGDWVGGFEHYQKLQSGALVLRPAAAVDAIQTYAIEGDIEIIISEFNAVDFEKIWPWRNDLGHALVAFDLFGESLRLPYFTAGLLWTTRWMHAERPDKMWYALDGFNRLTAMGQALALWGSYFKASVVSTETSIAALSSHALADDKSGALTVFMINKSSEEMTAYLDIEGTDRKYQEAFLSRFGGRSDRDMYPSLQVIGPTLIRDNEASFVLPPTSLTVVDFQGTN